MAKIPRARRPRATTEAQLDDALLDGQPLPAQTASDLQALYALLRAADGPPTASELAGQRDAVAAFIRASAASQPRRLRKPAILARLSTIAVAAATGAAALGGAAAAAYSGALPAGAQKFAHHAIGAPAADDPGTDAVVTEPGDDDGTDAGATGDDGTN